MNDAQNQLRDYVVARLKQGSTIQDLTHEMMQAGWEAAVLQPVIVEAQQLHNQHQPIHNNHKRKLFTASAIIVVVIVAGLVIGQMLATSFDEGSASREQGDIQISLDESSYRDVQTPVAFAYKIPLEWQFASEPLYLDSISTYQSSYYNYDNFAVDAELIERDAIKRPGQSLLGVENRGIAAAPFSIDEMYEVQIKIEPLEPSAGVDLVGLVNSSFADTPERQVADMQTYVINGERQVADYILDNQDEGLLDQRRIRFISADGNSQAEVIVNRSHSLKPIDKTDFQGLLEMVSSVTF